MKLKLILNPWLIMACNYILFSKLPYQETAKGSFGFSQGATCLPHMVQASHCPFNYWTSSKDAVNNFYNNLGLTQSGIEPKSTVSAADTLSTWPWISYLRLHIHCTYLNINFWVLASFPIFWVSVMIFNLSDLGKADACCSCCCGHRKSSWHLCDFVTAVWAESYLEVFSSNWSHSICWKIHSWFVY